VCASKEKKRKKKNCCRSELGHSIMWKNGPYTDLAWPSGADLLPLTLPSSLVFCNSCCREINSLFHNPKNQLVAMDVHLCNFQHQQNIFHVTKIFLRNINGILIHNTNSYTKSFRIDMKQKD